MRKLKYIWLFILSAGLLNSCLVDDSTDSDNYDKGANVAGFESMATSVAAIADGQEYSFTLKVKVIGPTSMDLKGDIEVTLGVDATSTAIAGTHFRIDNNKVVLKASNNYLGLMEFKMLTNGIETPLDKSPVLVLNVESVTGDIGVLPSGRLLAVTLNYSCPSDLAGTYDVVTYRPDNGLTYTWTEDIVETGLGEYKTEMVGTWAAGSLSGDYGYIFTDVCGVLNVPTQNLRGAYSNEVFGAGTSDPDAGTMHVEYTITFDAGDRLYISDYTKVK